MFGATKKEMTYDAEREPPFIAQNLVDVGGDLSIARLLRGYQNGSFPWTVNPVTWWSPDPRTIIEFENFHASKSLRRTLRKGIFQATVNEAFVPVIRACAAPTPGRRTTWIAPEFIEAYTALHKRGHAHSVEVWHEGKLVGGIYGIGIGAYFAGESMFHRMGDASKVALYHLMEHLKAREYILFDVQMPTRVTMQMGASFVPRSEFLRRLSEALMFPVTFGASLESAPLLKD
jgi:leucyl/phenylalanyl-tRNA--protein transferase